ncbi:FAD binding domain-containing protein [Serinibacter salmoneus]|uniref:CO/xanthine dehydrogenase FAD-binding subunit n=1 Tax=Serinibacter salmoneus TaxID=556530 RepID=A0A2A9CYR6_9MICO|nr:FAD binding domain-containing protein [Serinibacter salmoneus]PFG18760.1 CO/xanthine dehydrogenase FAD-binding subunit [Serinibacter salmoneus]
MDITSVTSYRTARSRADLVLAPGERLLAGGTWLMSEPQPGVTGLVDLTGLGWEPIEVSGEGVRIAATCTIADLVAWAPTAPADWRAATLIPQAANALLASFKIWNTATVGGNIARAYAAAAMVAMCATLEGVAEIWRPDGADRHAPVADLVTGNGRNALASGEVLRAVTLPAAALRARATLRKIALAEHGRSGAVVTGRLDSPADGGGAVVTITAATAAPTVLRFPALPATDELAAAVAGAPGYYTDPLGSADWRRGVSVVLARRVREELAREELTSAAAAAEDA